MLSIKRKAEEAKRLWDAWNAGEAYRVPVVLNISTRYWAEALRVDPIRYFFEPVYQMQMQLEGQKWVWENVPMDQLEPTPKAWYHLFRETVVPKDIIKET